MNLVIVLGKIVSNVEFKFIYNRYSSKELKDKTSIATCRIELLNKSIVKVYGYDNIADYMYRNLKVNDSILIEGKLDSLCNIEIIYLN